jgi:predicted Zn-dependent peptidase
METGSVCAADVLTVIIGDARSGRLTNSLKQLYSPDNVGADFTTLSRNAALIIYARPNSPDQLSTVKQRLEAEMQKLRTAPVSDEELDFAKRRLLGSYLFDIETYSGQARTLGLNEMASTYTFATDYFDNVRKLKPKDVQDLVAKYIASSRQMVVLFKPAVEK